MKKPLMILLLLMIVSAPLFAYDINSYRSDWSIPWDEFCKSEQKIGLALGGGSVLGAAHIGVLKAIDELGIKIDYIAGTSIGAFVAGLYAFGLNWDEIEKISEDLNWMDISGLSFSNMGLLSNKKMGDLITAKIGPVNLEDSPIPIAMITADIETMEKVVLTKGSVAKASMASTCIPGIFVPVEIDGRLLVDGGIKENVPISILTEMGADVIIAVDLNSEHDNKRPENVLEVLLRTFEMMISTTTKYQIVSADIIIRPDLSEFNVVDINQSPDLIVRGYDEAMQILSNCYDDLQYNLGTK